MSRCADCEETVRSLYVDPRTPPLDEGNCLCRDCYVAAIDETIDDTERDLETLRYYRQKFLASDDGGAR